MNKAIFLFTSLIVLSSAVSANHYNFSAGERSEYDLHRDKLSKGPEIVALTNVKAGMTVLDVFGGGGYYSEIISEVVGRSGVVYLHNNQAYMPWIEKELVARLKDSRLNNVVRYDREDEDLELKAEQFDAVFHILGYHDLYHTADGWDVDKEHFLKQLVPSIKPGGQLIVVDHSAIEGSKTKYSQDLHRIDEQYVIDELTGYGFKLVTQSELLANEKDDRTISPFKPEMRRKSDRFILIFEKI